MARQLELFREGGKNKTRNWRLFDDASKAKNWKTDLLYPQAVMGGYRSLADPLILYKASQKRVLKYSRETHALEMTGINHLGAYHLSKHLFNLSFLHDPYLHEISKVRSRIEVIYQLGNYHLNDKGNISEGLFLRPMVIQYCEKVMQTNFDEIRAFRGFSRQFRLKQNLFDNSRHFSAFSRRLLFGYA